MGRSAADVWKQESARLMAAGEGEQARICHVDMTGNEAEEEGMVCGGEVDVFLEIV